MVQGLATTAVVATTGTATVVSTVSGSAAVQVPGSKFHYVRLVSAPTATQGSTVVPGKRFEQQSRIAMRKKAFLNAHF